MTKPTSAVTSWSIWWASFDGSSVTLELSHSEEESEVYLGTISGNSISASGANPSGGFACSGDTPVTRQTGANLTATLSGGTITGELTDVFGEGAGAVTLRFSFTASR